MARKKVPVTLRSVIQRINRRLDDDGKTLMAARSQGAREAIGEDYFVVGGGEAPTGVNIEVFARKIGALREWEELR